MTRTTVRISLSTVRKIALTIPCFECGAEPGMVCATGDDSSREMHEDRVAPMWSVFELGYRYGRRDFRAALVNLVRETE